MRTLLLKARLARLMLGAVDPPTVTVAGVASYAAASDVFTLTPDATNQTGAVMSNDRIDLTQDFTLTLRRVSRQQ